MGNKLAQKLRMLKARALRGILAFVPTKPGKIKESVAIKDNAEKQTQTVVVSGEATDFIIAAQPGAALSQTISVGQTTAFRLEVDSENGFTGTVTLSCNGLPSSVGTCSVSPGSVTLGGTSPG